MAMGRILEDELLVNTAKFVQADVQRSPSDQ